MDSIIKFEQPRKAKFPMDVTELGMLTEVRPVQFKKAHTPMDLTELGMLTVVRLLQVWKA